ncbi:hypothetical protein NBRC116493_12520 [Aurantivibrio infirmus]
MLLSALVLSLQPLLGHGSGQLDWNIGSDMSTNATPNVLSELNFDNIRTYQAGLNVGISFAAPVDGFRVLLEGGFSRGEIENGQAIDSDFAEDNRNGLYSKSTSYIRGDGTREYNIGVGLQYTLHPNRLVPFTQSLAMVYGGQQQEQMINLQKGQQLVAEPQFFGSSASIDSLNQRLASLDSDYDSSWSSHWLAADYQISISSWTLSARYQYFKGFYSGEGRWNLRENFQQPKSFTHEAESSGQQIQLGVAYAITRQIRAQLNWMSGAWQTEDGTSKTYFIDNTVQYTRFNEANWRSSALQFGVSYQF